MPTANGARECHLIAPAVKFDFISKRYTRFKKELLTVLHESSNMVQNVLKMLLKNLRLAQKTY